jgi:hypothetical protein
MRLNPFRALRPPPDFAAQVASVPYDVVDRDEAASLAAGNPRSFLHVGRPDIDLPAGTDPYDPSVYAQGRAALDGFLANGTLVRDGDRTVYVYRQEMDGRGQTGVVACVHVDDYEAYLKYNASTQPVAKPQTHPTKIPSGAGRYRTIGGVMRNGREIPHGTVAEFTAVEVASLTKPGMIAIEYAD